MHPKQICDDFAAMGAPIILEGTDLYINNPENIYPELEELAASYKSRIIRYLNGSYSDREHNINQTVDKIITFYLGIHQDMNEKINNWLNQDDEALEMVMQLFVDLSNNGWSATEPIANYESDETDKLSKEIFDRAMDFFRTLKKG